MYDEAEDNDDRYPDESPVEVRYPRSKQEEQADRGTWRDGSEIRPRTTPSSAASGARRGAAR